jgi:NADPH2:quinone reductase
VDEIPKPVLSEGKALIKTRAVGVNFKDIYHRRGQLTVDFPFIPGKEASGSEEEIVKPTANWRD